MENYSLANSGTHLSHEKGYLIIKRTFDIIISLLVLLISLPVFIVISLLILLFCGRPIFFFQPRLGKDRKIFKIIKFRTMKNDPEMKGPFISSSDDDRITLVGKYLRRYKLDELPQFINVLRGEMGIVGPRPEVEKFAVSYYNEFNHILSIRPGITDYASILYRNEAELLSSADDKETLYLKEILPQKIELNKKYLREASLATDFRIIFMTFWAILK